MKLYTEEVLRNSMNSVKYYIEHYDASTIDRIIDNHLKALTPIELPSDEEIADYSLVYRNDNASHIFVFKGAKWVIEQIKQQQL